MNSKQTHPIFSYSSSRKLNFDLHIPEGKVMMVRADPAYGDEKLEEEVKCTKENLGDVFKNFKLNIKK